MVCICTHTLSTLKSIKPRILDDLKHDDEKKHVFLKPKSSTGLASTPVPIFKNTKTDPKNPQTSTNTRHGHIGYDEWLESHPRWAKTPKVQQASKVLTSYSKIYLTFL